MSFNVEYSSKWKFTCSDLQLPRLSLNTYYNKSFSPYRFFEIFEKYDGYKLGHVKLKRPKQLQEILDIARFLLSEIHTKSHAEIEEKESKLEQLKNVLEMYGHFSGINRKVQMKYQPKGRPRGSSSDDGKFLSFLLT